MVRQDEYRYTIFVTRNSIVTPTCRSIDFISINKMNFKKNVNDKHVTDVCHMEDTNMSNVDSHVLYETIKWLRYRYEEEGESIQVYIVNIHEFLGMKMDFTEEETLVLSTYGHIN